MPGATSQVPPPSPPEPLGPGGATAQREGPAHPGATEPRGARDDRWAWRRRIRADPRRRRAYRVAIAVAGGTLVALGGLTGPLPGPGGIPLLLLGLAVLASEFVWARKVLDRARALARDATARVARQPRWLRLAGSAAAVALVVGAAWAALAVLGAPDLLPEPVTALLARLPGVE